MKTFIKVPHLLFFPTNLIFFPTNLIFSPRNLIFFTTNLIFFPTNLIFYPTATILIFFPIILILFNTNLIFFPTNFKLPRRGGKQLCSPMFSLLNPLGRWIQDDQLYMAVCFWYLAKSVRVFSSVHCTSHFLQGTRITLPCLSGQVV